MVGTYNISSVRSWILLVVAPGGVTRVRAGVTRVRGLRADVTRVRADVTRVRADVTRVRATDAPGVTTVPARPRRRANANAATPACDACRE